MEIAGVVIGAVALVGVFEDCIELLSQIGAAKSMEKDHTLLATRLDLQRALLLQWAERMNIYDEELVDARLSEATVTSLIYRTLKCICQLLKDGKVLQERYGVRAVERTGTAEPSTTVSNSLMARIRDMSLNVKSPSGFERGKSRHQPSDITGKTKRSRSDFESSQSGQAELSHQRLDNDLQNKRPRNNTYRSRLENQNQNSYSNRAGKLPVSQKIKWIIKDKDQFDSLVRKLSELISDIDRLVPPQTGHAPKHTILARDMQTLDSVQELRKIMYASRTDNRELINITQQAIDEACTRLIHTHLWFRLIDDRESSIVDAHSQTFEWSIHPPTSEVVWDDLGQWLRSGRDIYWIHGKPGSGKSTLMKFLYYHPEVKSSLHEWAGDRKLTLASFFLWNIGSIEQSSQEGLARGLLYHVLKRNPELTSTLLPHMWQEAQTGETHLKLPSNSEMKIAFQQIGAQKTTGAFAFFIDGLDEFTGNHQDGISFVKHLASNANIKLLVSSRPIDKCVAAFSSGPNLRLQDLTKPDIEIYINDAIRSHRYVSESNYLSDTTIQGLMEDIQSKASGVFLWVVLACRTLIEGFEAYDDAEELRRRVDELPPELERLFRHILDGLPSRFVQQAAKLLRICYMSRLLQIEVRISAFRLAWAHEKDMKPHAFGQFTPVFLDEKNARCAMLKGRLRSRCRGLLEVSTMGVRSRDDPSVDFMHRTVFEFLSTPAVWEMCCLQIHDAEFDATIVLAYMSCYSLFLDPERDARFAIGYVDEIYKRSPSKLRGLLNRLAFAIVKPIDEGHASSTIDLDSSIDHSAFLLAIELNLTKHIQSYDLCELRGHGSTLGRSLLCYAFEQPLLCSTSMRSYARSDQDMVDHLIRSGCDPNEMTRSWTGHRTTPWETWLDSISDISSDHKEVINVVRVTMTMIRAGAKTSGHEQDLRSLSDAWSQLPRSLVNMQEQEWLPEISSEVEQALGTDHDDTNMVATDYEDDASEAETDEKSNSSRQATDDEGDLGRMVDGDAHGSSDD